MRTKHVLMAMALPALFAACTSDDFMEEQSGASLSNRPLLSDGLTINVADPASTRFAWTDTNYSWAFEEGDQFGAAVVDPTTIDNVSSEHMLGNYIFSKTDAGWQTNSQMVVGTYMFYSYDGFQKKNTRDLIEFDLGTQEADLSNAEEAVNSKQLFFSPLYKLEQETTAEPLDLVFYPYWSTAAFLIENKTGQDLKITQIALNDAGAAFEIKGQINPQALNKAGLKYAYDKEQGEYVYDKKTFKDDAAFAKAMQETDLTSDDAETSSAIALNCDGYLLANGESVTAYMVVPAHTSKKLTADIIVTDEDGLTKQVTVDETGTSTNIACTGINTRVFKRGNTFPVFGFNTDGKTMKPLVIEKKNLADLKSFYVDNKEDLLRVINNNRGEISIYNFGDLAIDDEIAEAISEYTGAGITFENAISVKCTGAAELTKTTFEKNVTVESGNVTFGEGVEVDGDAGIVVEGGKLTLVDGTYSNVGATVEGGELVLNGAAPATITNNAGIVTIEKKPATLPNITFGGELDEDGKPVVNTLNVNADIDVTNLTVGKCTTVNNAAEITVSGTLTNKGTFNNGTANDGDAKVLGDGTFTNNATVNNYGTVKTATVENEAKATVNNYKYFGMDEGGNAKTSKNDGNIVMKKSTSRVYVSTGNGEIDNTANGVVSSASATNVAITVSISENMKNDEVLKNLGDFTKLYLNGGTWTVDNVDNLGSLENDVDLVLNGGTVNIVNVELKVKSLHVAKTSTVMGRDKENSKLTSTGAITAASGAKLNVEFATVASSAYNSNVSLASMTATGTYYLDGANNKSLDGTGTEGTTLTFKAATPVYITGSKTDIESFQAEIVIGENVTLGVTGATLSGLTSEVAPADADEANANETLMAAIEEALPDFAAEDSKVTISGGNATAEFTGVEFASSVEKKITVEWNGEAWVVTKVED